MPSTLVYAIFVLSEDNLLNFFPFFLEQACVIQSELVVIFFSAPYCNHYLSLSLYFQLVCGVPAAVIGLPDHLVVKCIIVFVS